MEKYTFFIPKYKVTCSICNEVIISEHEGEYKECSCGESFIDETTYYFRYRGKVDEISIEDYIWGKSNKNKVRIKDLKNNHIIDLIYHFELFKDTNNSWYQVLLRVLESRKLNRKQLEEKKVDSISIFKPKKKVICNNCNETIYCKKEGQFCFCSCENSWIEETRTFCHTNEESELKDLTQEDFRNFTWGTLEGKYIRIRDLTDEHLINIISYLEENTSTDNYYYELMKNERTLRNL